MSEAPRPPQSFLAGGVQQELLKIEDLPDSFYVGEESGINEGAPRYTAERFFRKRPVDYGLCVEFLAEGKGLLKISRMLKVHHQTVAAVRDIEGAAIDIQKERIRRNLRTAIDIGAERLPDVIAALPGGQVPLAIAVLIDKLAMMDGEPTSRVEHVVKGHLTHDAILANLAAFPEAIEVEASPMVSHGEIEPQKGAGDGSGSGSGSAPGPTSDRQAK